jgi:hypothetical protein
MGTVDSTPRSRQGRSAVKNRCVWQVAATMFVASLAGGCLQLELTFKLQEDGTALVTERIRFSEALLDLAKDKPNFQLEPLLTREAAIDRMKRMGTGITLVSHELRDAGGGNKESVAVYKVEDLNGFQYASPFLAYTDYAENHVVKCHFEPLYKSRNYSGEAGELAISFRPLKPPRREARIAENETPPPGPPPVQVQAFREVAPLFRDLLKDFQVKMTFEAYCPIRATGFGWRGYKERVKHVDLINFTDKDLDIYGSKFIDNEEIMLDLLRGKVGSKNVADTVYAFTTNTSVPIFLPWGGPYARWIQSDEIYIPPSRPIFDTYFAGKELDPSHWAPGPKKPALFEEIGWREGQTTTRPAPTLLIPPTEPTDPSATTRPGAASRPARGRGTATPRQPRTPRGARGS